MTFVALLVILACAGIIADQIMGADREESARAYLATIAAELEIAGDPTHPAVEAPVRLGGDERLAQIIDQDTGNVVLSTDDRLDVPMVDPLEINGLTHVTTSADPLRAGTSVVLAAREVRVDEKSYVVIGGVTGADNLIGWNMTTLTASFVTLVASLGVGVASWISVRAALKPVDELAREAEEASERGRSGSWTLTTRATTAEIDTLVTRLGHLLERVHEGQEHERQFLEDASHDLRTPITVARAEMDLAKSTSTDPDTQAALSSAIEELDRLDRLTADLLILAKMRSKPESPDEQVHLGHLVRQSVARMMRSPHRRDVTITVEGKGTVRGDPLVLERAFENILANALKYTATTVDVKISQTDIAASIRVIDDGPGFPEQLLPRVTERFAQPPDAMDGTGLGIPIADEIARSHGGSLEIHNKPDGGAEVTLYLAIAQRSPTDAAASSETSVATETDH